MSPVDNPLSEAVCGLMPLGVTFLSGSTLTPIFMNSVKLLQLHTRGLGALPTP